MRAARLLALLSALRRRRRPVTAATLAEELGVSTRTLYRDVATLQAQGAPIEGEAGLGYVLRPGFFLPPLMFDQRQADAIMLGLMMVRRRADPELAAAADEALGRIGAALPAEIADQALASGLRAGGNRPVPPHLGAIRTALETERKLCLTYRDGAGRGSERVVWPIAIGFLEAAEVLAAWCESRRDFRHFRLDRIQSVAASREGPPRRRRILLAEWRASQGVPD